MANQILTFMELKNQIMNLLAGRIKADLKCYGGRRRGWDSLRQHCAALPTGRLWELQYSQGAQPLWLWDGPEVVEEFSRHICIHGGWPMLLYYENTHCKINYIFQFFFLK